MTCETSGGYHASELETAGDETGAHVPAARLPMSESQPLSAHLATSLRSLARRALRETVERTPELTPPPGEWEPWSQRVVDVLACNVRSGRYRSARPNLEAGAPDLAELADYARQVTLEILREYELIEALISGDAEGWHAVIQRLEQYAYRWLGPNGRPGWAAEEAREMVAATCGDLWRWLQQHPYPFDVPFAHWAARALVNRLHDSSRSRRREEKVVVDSLDRPITSGDAAKTLGETLPDPRADEWPNQVAELDALQRAMRGIPAADQSILDMWYLQGMSGAQIAAALGHHVAYVFVLRHRAIKSLRRMWEIEAR